MPRCLSLLLVRGYAVRLIAWLGRLNGMILGVLVSGCSYCNMAAV